MALEQALQVNRMDQEVSRHLLIITDVEVSDGGRILRLASEDSRRQDRRRISILCIDAAPNSFLALELAERGGGMARFLTSDPKEGDITTALGSIMEFWSRTIYTNLRLFSNRHVVAADREVSDIGNGYCYVNLGDMPAGQPVWVSGKIMDNGNQDGDSGSGELSFCLMTKDSKKLEPLTPDITKRIEVGTGIKPFFGARKLLGLEFLIHSRYSEKEFMKSGPGWAMIRKRYCIKIKRPACTRRTTGSMRQKL
jgi:Ca-activated chloride channel family protein